MKIPKKLFTALLLTTLVLSSAKPVFAVSTVDLGTAGNFAVLAGSGIVNSNPSVITGDAGSSPTTTNGLTAGEVAGTNYIGASAVVDLAQDDLTTAYLEAEAHAATTIATELGGTVVTPGVYETASGEFGITGTVTLDAEGDEDAVFIFQAGSTLITASDSNVVLINGAQACNVFWQVTSSATLGTSSDFKGNILALVSITDNGGSTVDGRLLARNGAVTLNDTTVTEANCTVPTPAPTSTSSSSRSGDFKRCDTPFTPTCVEYFSVVPLVLGTTTVAVIPPVFTPGMPSTGGIPISSVPLLIFSLSLGAFGFGVAHLQQIKSR